MTTDASQAKKLENDLGSDTPAASSFRGLLNSIATVLPPPGSSSGPLTGSNLFVTGAASLYPATAPGTAWVPVQTVAVNVTDVSRPLLALASVIAVVNGAGGLGTPGGGNIRVVAFPNGTAQAPVVLWQKGTGNQETIPVGIFELSGSGLYLAPAPGTLTFQLQASNATAAGQMVFPVGQQNAPTLTVVQP